MVLLAKTVPQFLFLCMFVATCAVSIFLSKKGKMWDLRRIAGIDAIEDAMGRATEMNRPVSYWLGEGALHDAEGAQTVASFSILSHVARLAARFDTPFFAAVTIAETTPAVADICRSAYVVEGKEDEYNEAYTVRQAVGTATYVQQLMVMEKISVNIMMGSLGMPSLTYIEEANNLGAISIAGTSRISNACFLAACADYVILSDEFFAAAAFLSKDRAQLCTINTADVWKMISVALAVLGPVLYVAGIINLSKILYP